ncbi:uncharacterized protein [Temnothorax nylanderi]|uniref:uncharacterized protein n=1 Tax=Temnothorax nylanderi TaxID=102681 RepID=UPI003A85AFA8
MSAPTFVDLQGFVVGMKFVVKEAAVLRNGTVLAHYIFTCPMPWNLFTKSDKSCASWLIRNHHGLRWEDGNVPYSKIIKLYIFFKLQIINCIIILKVISFIFFYSISLERRAVRILSRRYALTATGYKFLEVGVNVGPPSYVEIAVGDHRGTELILSLETWKGFHEQRRNIQNFLRYTKDTCDFISVGPLTLRICTINGVKLVRLESLNVRLTMTESTLHRMLDLDLCIDTMFHRLSRIVETVDVKFTQFSKIASTVTNPTQVLNVIRDSDAFDKHQLVDCELAALFFSALP